MSAESWSREFLPVPPEEIAKWDVLGILHATSRMWQGTTPEALGKHGLDHWFLLIGGGWNNPLCLRYHSDCRRCPITVMGYDCVAPMFRCTDEDTSPMRELLETVTKEWEKTYGRCSDEHSMGLKSG